MLQMNLGRTCRIPTRVDCPSCKAIERAALNAAFVEAFYEYVCELCGKDARLTPADVNATVVSITRH